MYDPIVGELEISTCGSLINHRVMPGVDTKLYLVFRAAFSTRRPMRVVTKGFRGPSGLTSGHLWWLRYAAHSAVWGLLLVLRWHSVSYELWVIFGYSDITGTTVLAHSHLGPFYWHGLTLWFQHGWIITRPCQVWDEIIMDMIPYPCWD